MFLQECAAVLPHRLPANLDKFSESANGKVRITHQMMTANKSHRSRIFMRVFRRKWNFQRCITYTCEMKVMVMMVRYEDRLISRTCGSVRSSRAAPARLVTVGSEAAVTTFLHRPDEESAVRRSSRLRASTRSEKPGWMTGPTQVNCPRHRKIRRAKDADRLQPKGAQPVVPPCSRNARTLKAAGV